MQYITKKNPIQGVLLDFGLEIYFKNGTITDILISTSVLRPHSGLFNISFIIFNYMCVGGSVLNLTIDTPGAGILSN